MINRIFSYIKGLDWRYVATTVFEVVMLSVVLPLALIFFLEFLLHATYIETILTMWFIAWFMRETYRL